MKTKYNSQSGFAIGTILLAVVLIAAIVSAIAIASRGSSSQSNREGARVQASTILQQGINLKQGFDRMSGTGTLAANVVLSDSDTAAGGPDGLGNTSTLGTGAAAAINFTTGTNCIAGDPCIYDPTNGGTTAQSPPTAALFAGAPAGVRYIIRNLTVNRGGTEIGTAAADRVILLSGLRDDVCRQLNQMAASVNVSNAPNTSGVAVLFTNAAGGQDAGAATVLTAVGVGDAAGAPQAAVPSPEGCVQQQGVANQFMYYKVIAEQ